MGGGEVGLMSKRTFRMHACVRDERFGGGGTEAVGHEVALVVLARFLLAALGVLGKRAHGV